MALIRRPPQKFNFLVSYKNASSRNRHLIGPKLSTNRLNWWRASCNTFDTCARGSGYFCLLREQYHYKPPKASQGAAALPGAHAASASPQSEV
jgi:hypothetical protein